MKAFRNLRRIEKIIIVLVEKAKNLINKVIPNVLTEQVWNTELTEGGKLYETLKTIFCE